MPTATKEASLRTQEPPPQANASERFTDMVMTEFNGNISGGLEITDYQRQLIQGYFIGIDRMLHTQEDNRLRKNAGNSDHKYDNDLPYDWRNVNLRDLALDVVHFARMGLDMMQKNHVSPIPFKNNKNNQYDINLMTGYAGIEYIATKYALDPPVSVTVELVYSTDTFRPLKKSHTNRVENYEFEIINPFNRGEIIGGFGYIEYDDPVKNTLVIMTKADIEKRKPQYASAEFWGGVKKTWENGRKVEVETDGWYPEMCLKTIKREVYGGKHIPRDPKKIDDNYQYMKMREARIAEFQAQDEIAENANKATLIIDTGTGEVTDPKQISETSGAAPPPPDDDLP